MTAHLEGSWSATPAAVGDAVSLVTDVYQHDGAAHAVVDDRAGLLVLHPDLLLSGSRPFAHDAFVTDTGHKARRTQLMR